MSPASGALANEHDLLKTRQPQTVRFKDDGIVPIIRDGT
jgi:hypothetical protein